MRLIVPLLCVLIAFPPALSADDGAASIGAGGIILMKREPRIVMAKEILQISTRKIIVDYDFRNESDEDISTLVAFPVPAYGFGEEEDVFGDPAFSDFHLTVNDAPLKFLVEIRAFVGKRDITALLAREHVDAATFGHWDVKQHDFDQIPDFQHATPAARTRLIAEGAFKDNEPNWKVAKKYYWTQTFPARGITHISHSYTPVLGGTNSVSYGLMAKAQPPSAQDRKNPQMMVDRKATIDEINSLCIGAPLEAKLLKLVQRKDMSIPFNYVAFILTTANTWKTPIEDFTLIVDRPRPNKSIVSMKPAEPRPNEALVSFCWNGPVEKTDSTHYTAHLKNFIPDKELHVGFVYVDQQDPVVY